MPSPPLPLNDPLLRAYLEASHEVEIRRQLDALMREIEPLLQRVVRRRWSITPGTDRSRATSPEDLLAEMRLALLRRLQVLREDPEGRPIAQFLGFAARTAHHAVDTAYRKEGPARAGLKSQLSDLLTGRTSQQGFAVWDGAPGERLCGFAAWREPGRALHRTRRCQQLVEHPAETGRAVLPGEDLRRVNPAVLAAALFNWVGSPLDVDDLVNVFSVLWEVRESQRAERSANPDAPPDPLELAPDGRVDVAGEVEQRAFLRQLWDEIRQLPPRQRAALLLNLRDGEGHGVIAFFPLRGVATLQEVAAALELDWDRFCAVWEGLPLEDNAIAELLGCTRQQVINLRKVARERLGRRLR